MIEGLAVKLKHFFVVCVFSSLCLLVGCTSNPLKPPRPDGKRVAINLTPPPAIDGDDTPAAIMPAVLPATAQPRHGGSHE